jgi:hypothetical protein
MSEAEISADNTVPKLSALQKIIGMFTNPVAVFENLRLYPDWLVPVSLVILTSILFVFSTSDLTLELQKEAIYNNSLVPEEYKDKAIENIEGKTEMQRNLEGTAGSVINVLLVFFVASGAFFIVGNFILGGEAKFKQVFSMYSWVGLVGVVELLVKLPMALAKGSLHVYTSLAVLMEPGQEKTVLFGLLNAIDLFTIWKIILWATGMSVIYRFSKAKGYTAAISLYIIVLAVSIGFNQLF